MRLLQTLLLLLALRHTSNAQYDKNNRNDSTKIVDSKYTYHVLNVDKNERSTVHLPFDTIIFQDVRFDTTFFAMKYPLFNYSNIKNFKETFYGGLANSMTEYFNTYYSTKSNRENNSLICFIKKFSITLQYDFLEHYNADLKNNLLNQVDISVECYYKDGENFYPAIKLDTSYTHHFPGIIFNVNDIIKQLFVPLMSRIEQADTGRITKRKAYTNSEITKRYAQRFNIPILKTSTYKKGVYKSFNEFKNNAPSIDSFSLSIDKLKVNASSIKKYDLTSLAYRATQKKSTAVFLYDKDDQLITPSDVFGYSDGETLWIQHGAFFYPLQRVSNSFEFMYVLYYNDGNDHTITAHILSPLNMESGKSN